jgi:hypothetical protein
MKLILRYELLVPCQSRDRQNRDRKKDGRGTGANPLYVELSSLVLLLRLIFRWPRSLATQMIVMSTAMVLVLGAPAIDGRAYDWRASCTKINAQYT